MTKQSRNQRTTFVFSILLLLLRTLALAPTSLAFAFSAISSPRSSKQHQHTSTRWSISIKRRSPPILLFSTARDVLDPALAGETQTELDDLELVGDACIIADPKEDAQLWSWRILMLAITSLWGANFAIVKQAADVLGTGEAITLFNAGRFLIGATLLSPALIKTSSMQVVKAAAVVGTLTTFGYVAQAAAVGMGTQAGTAAFICSLNTVVVAVMVGQKTGCVSPRTWWAIGISVLGVACLELPSVLGGGADFCLGDLVSFGQPLGFGASYVFLEQALADHPEDELPIAALQVLVTCLAALAAASFAYGGAPLWELPWDSLLPNTIAAADSATASAGLLDGLDWSVTGPLIYSGVITSALTIWLQMIVFSKLPAVDASLLLTTEPLFATFTAVLLLGDVVGANDYAGGFLILMALLVQQGVIFNDGFFDAGPRLTYDKKSKPQKNANASSVVD